MAACQALPVSDGKASGAQGDLPGAPPNSDGGHRKAGAKVSVKEPGSGGFDLPPVYKGDRDFVVKALNQGDIDHAAMSRWQFPDEFLCFALETGFFDFVDRSYPTPRKKTEVPIWFLSHCQLILRLHLSGRYDQLNHFLNSTSILSRVGFNIGNSRLGFNEKNRYDRKTAVNPDTVRKFFKDSDRNEIRNWYNESVQGWFRGKRAFDAQGIFVLDQTHLVVPNNSNYEEAVRMPVDEHGQWYTGYDRLTDEQKKVLPRHPCYALSLLLNSNPSGDFFHIAGYEYGPGSEDELAQAKRLLPDFCRVYRGVMRELIVDRGYIDGEFLGTMKRDHGVDVLIPLKSSMSSFQDAVAIAERHNSWIRTEHRVDAMGKLLKETFSQEVPDVDLWSECPVKLQLYVSKTKRWSTTHSRYDEYVWVLGATKRYPSVQAAIERYGMRAQIEEKNRQFKLGWEIGKFTSPAASLMESHICFTLLTYSLLQLYLRRQDLRDQTNRMMIQFQNQERMNGGAITVYAEDRYGVLGLREYSEILLRLDETAKQKILAMQTTVHGDMRRPE